MTDTAMNWRQAYARRAQQIIGARDVSIGELAQELDMLTDDAAEIAVVLQRWQERAAAPGTGTVWHERTNT